MVSETGIQLQPSARMIDVSERRSIFITGAASGIGLATARLFKDQGWFVGGYDVDRDGIDALSGELGDGGVTGLLDVRDKEAVDTTLAAFVQAAGGRLDLMFNNAGIAVAGNLDDVPFDRLRDVVDINLMGVLNGMHAAIPHLATTPNSLCFTTASSAAVFGTAGMAVYGATKAAVDFLSASLRAESQGRIKVTTVKPTGVPGTNLGSGIVNDEAIVGILGHNAARYGQQLQSMGQGDAPLEYTDANHIEYAALEPQYLAQQILYAIGQP